MRNAKPSLLVFSHISSPDYVTGAEKLLFFTMRELIPRYACMLVVSNEGVIAAQARALGIPVVMLNIPIIPSLNLGLPHVPQNIERRMSEPFWPELIALLLRLKPDAVLVNTSVHPLPAIAAKAMGIPVIWTVMEVLQETPHTAACAAFIAGHADRIVGISAATLRPFGNERAERTLLLPPSWREEDLAPDQWPLYRAGLRSQLGIGEEQRLVGFIAGTIYGSKGFHAFMDMAVRLAVRCRCARFLIVGNPMDAGYFEDGLAIARSSGMLDLFRWIRFAERIEQVYPAMDVVVVPSLGAEGFGMTALEGMAFGKPVVSFASGGLSEIHEMTGSAAWSVGTGDVESLTAAVFRLLSDERLLQETGERNRVSAGAAFGIGAYQSRLAAFCESVKDLPVVSTCIVKGSSPVVYKREGDLLRPYSSEKAFLEDGRRWEDVRRVPQPWIAAMPKGEALGRPASGSVPA
ncbi:glycosyltransferase, partial [Paenibacillus darwinianus]